MKFGKIVKLPLCMRGMVAALVPRCVFSAAYEIFIAVNRKTGTSTYLGILFNSFDNRVRKLSSGIYNDTKSVLAFTISSNMSCINDF